MENKQYDGTFLPGQHVYDTTQEFMCKYKLKETCKFFFNMTVCRIEKMNDDTWNVTSSDNVENVQTTNFDFCVICTGMYHTPNIPNELQHFKPIHSSEFANASICTDKNVIVIGGGKSAIDCAVAASKYSRNVKLVMRELQWPVPRYILNLIPFKRGTYFRLGHALLPKHWFLCTSENILHTVLYHFKFLAWKFLELAFSFQFELSQKPRIPLVKDLFNGGQILTYELRDAVRSGMIEEVVTNDVEEYIEANYDPDKTLVICGTGFSKNYQLFDDITRNNLDICDDGMWLYKNILPVEVSHLAFIGSEVSTFNNILTHHLQAMWLTHHLSTKFPSKKEMQYFVREWKISWMSFSASRASLIQLHMTKYHDILMQDMNLPLVKRKWWQWSLPIMSRDYKKA